MAARLVFTTLNMTEWNGNVMDSPWRIYHQNMSRNSISSDNVTYSQLKMRLFYIIFPATVLEISHVFPLFFTK